ncbi:MAG: gliding motility-associated C-terminal domain-containing protein [Taibaiella sp.]|nr:gliding motility-associated C-terminal domain-containing protein [Taibaiella sp.]
MYIFSFKRFFVVFLLAQLFIKGGYGQNLVINPSFEEHVMCPIELGCIGPPTTSSTCVLKWFRPSSATTDYFHSCVGTISFVSVPKHFTGYQYPKTGDAYVGIFMSYAVGSPLYCEYIQGKLHTPLISDHEYYCNYWVNRSNNFETNSLNKLEAYFSVDYVNEPSLETILDFLIPQISSVSSEFFDDTLEWQCVSGTFIAEGAEEWITIGLFSTLDESDVKYPEDLTSYFTWYYYIDDVCVLDLDNTPSFIHTFSDSFCSGSHLTLSPSEEGDFDYVWNDGSKEASLIIYEEGIYWVKIIDKHQCSFSIDSFLVKAVQPATIISTTDTVGCYDIPMHIGQYYPHALAYKWNTGEETIQIEVKQEETYYASISTFCTTYVDTYYVSFQEDIDFDLGPDTMICKGDIIELIPRDVTGVHIELDWNVPSTNQSIQVNDSGIYILNGTDHCENTYSDSVLVSTALCDDCVQMPTAFSPNGDGLNDLYQAVTLCSFYEFNLSIYNRYGQRVYSSSQESEGWDGMVRGIPADAGAYFYHLEATTLQRNERISFKGDLMLIR